MQQFIFDYYNWFKTIHLFAAFAWMAGMFYLPRLFVYHAAADKGSELSETLKIMERRLLKIIMNPAMIAVWVIGILMLWANFDLMQEGWLHVKLTAVFLLSGLHGALSKYVRVFSKDENTKSEKFFRILNEVPTVFLLIILVMVIVKPF